MRQTMLMKYPGLFFHRKQENTSQIMLPAAVMIDASRLIYLKMTFASQTYLPIGQRPIALLDSSKSINIKSISTAATIYLMLTAHQNCKINCLYSVFPGKLEVIMLIALINWYKSYVLFHCHNIDHSNNNNR